MSTQEHHSAAPGDNEIGQEPAKEVNSSDAVAADDTKKAEAATSDESVLDSEENYEQLMQVPYERYVDNLRLQEEEGRKGIRFTIDPKIYRHKKIAQHQGVDVFQGFDNMPDGSAVELAQVKVATPGALCMSTVTRLCMTSHLRSIVLQALCGILISREAQKLCAFCAGSSSAVRRTVFCWLTRCVFAVRLPNARSQP